MNGWLTRGARRKWAVIASFTFLVACVDATFPVRSSALSISEEKELGAKILDVIKEHMPLVEDGEVITYVQSIGKRIVSHIGPTPYEYQFFIVNEPVPNAFAIPGGYIFLYRGLIEIMQSEGELAGIISHELSHIQARHIHRRMEEGRIINIATIAGALAGILLGTTTKSNAAGALTLGSAAGGAALQLKYSRENEEEADQLGLRYLVAAGYPANDMANGMLRLIQGRYVSNSRIPSYLSTHPALSERVSYLSDLAQKERASGKRAPRKAALGDFSMMQAALIADYADPQIASDRFQSAAKESESFAIYGLGRLALRQGDFEKALPYLQKVARMEASSSLALSTLGAAYYKTGNLPEAQKVLQSALVLDPSASIVHLRLAMISRELGQKDEALEHLQRIEDLAPTFPEIDYQMGVVLGQLNRLGPAHFYLGRYYESRHDWKVALFHFGKAKALLRESHHKFGDIDRMIKDVEKKRNEAQWKPMRG